jgi:hypothetical protein
MNSLTGYRCRFTARKQGETDMPANAGTEEIRQAYIRMYEGMISKDEKVLNEVLDDSFVLVHMTGMRQPKQAFIKAVLNGTLNYFSAEHENMPVESKRKIIARSLIKITPALASWSNSL